MRGMEKALCMGTFQFQSESGGSRNAQTSAQLFGIDPSPQWCRLGGVGNAHSAQITCNQVNLSTNHDGMDCKDEFFPNTQFFCVDIVFLGHRKGLLAAEWWTTN